MPQDPTLDYADPARLEEGIALALRAEESGDWKPLVDWITRNVGHAAEIGEFLKGQDGLRSVVRPVRLDQAGAVLGGYALIEEIGRGGMGVVYRARDSVLKRDVAIKLVRTETAFSSRTLARFRFEAETVAALDHRNIVSVFASGESAGMPYLVMPLMEGGSLAHKLKRDGVYTPDDAAKLIRDVAGGIHHAHQAGLIHRDLKPGNILLDPLNQPKVADFGLARSLEDAPTLTGGIAGTPAYMAPEQARGDKRLTVAVDIHALGVILFELLAGRTPLGSEDMHRTLKNIREEPAPSVHAFRADVPADLATICRRCLAREPADRYPSASALAESLTCYLNRDPLPEHSGGGILTSLARAFGRRRETREMSTWATPFWGAASSLLALFALQLALLFDAPRWVSDAALAYYLVAWFGIVWYFLLARRHDMNPVETGSLATQFGMIAAASLVTLPHWLDGSRIELTFPSLAAVVGLGVYVHGATYWGRLYLAGIGIMSTAAIMPLISMRLWPGLYGLAVSVFQVWVGIHLLAIHRQSRKDA